MSHRIRAQVLLAAFAGAGLSVAAPRSLRAETTQDVEQARALFIAATELGKEGHWKDARDLYARSLLLKNVPLTRYSLGVAQRETGQFADALASFRAFVGEGATSATAPYRSPAETAIAALEAQVGRVVIAIEPAPVEGLALTIDGSPAPPFTARPREVDPGMHVATAHALGFRPATLWFSAKAGNVILVRLTLIPTAPAPRALVAQMAPLVPRAADGPSADMQDAKTGDEWAPRRIAATTLLAAGSAFFVIGAAVGLVGVREAATAPTSDGPDASAARTKSIAGDVLAGTGLVGAGVGLALLLTQGHAAPAAGTSIRPWASGATGGLALRF